MRLSFRRFVFWLHLAIGVLAGIVILMMSATGVLLTYERQIVEWAERSYTVHDDAGAQPLAADEYMHFASSSHPDEDHFFVRFLNRRGAAVPVWAGNHSYLLNPYSGDVLRKGEGSVTDFFKWITTVHRWFAVEGEGVDLARAVTAYSNLLFLGLIITGVYLWLPRSWGWQHVKWRIFLPASSASTKARDYKWHHALSFWSVLPLSLIVLTATIFYFSSWANEAIYGLYGEAVPVRERAHEDHQPAARGLASYESLFQRAKMHASENDAADWHSMWMEVGAVPGAVEFYIDRSIGRRPDYAYNLVLDEDDGRVLEVKHSTDWSRGDQAWAAARYLHTGELYGVFGQTIAGLASMAACLLVYTGLALAWRRLVSPKFKK